MTLGPVVPRGYKWVALSNTTLGMLMASLNATMGIFFSLMILGLSAQVPSAMYHGLVTHGVAAGQVTQLSHLPAIGYLFAAFLGYNPLQSLLGAHTLGTIPRGDAAPLTSKQFFPQLIAGPFHSGLVVAFSFALAMCLLAAGASWLRGGRYVYREQSGTASLPEAA